ncbi:MULTISPECIES: response regulator transcription factor [unclassified Gordonia (in: high G+C Gram-positive bacteria)]
MGAVGRRGDTRSRYAALIELATALTEVDDLAELGELYFESIGEIMDLPMKALYLFGDEPGTPSWYESRNVSDRFMTTYEQLGRPIDDELRQVLTRFTPVYNLAGRSLDEWRRTEIYQRVDRLENMLHVLKAPMVHNGAIVGTVDFASDSLLLEVDQVDMDLISAIGQIVGGAVANLRSRTELQHRLDVSLLAVNSSAAAVVYFAASSIEPTINRSAAGLLGDLQEGTDILYRVLRDVGGSDSLLHRSYLVRLKNGSKDVLECTARPVPGEPGAHLLELELESSRAQYRSHALQRLSAREYDVAGLVAAGFSDREIADELVLSLHTVRQHVKNIYAKLGVSSRVHLTRMYHGMTPRTETRRG